MTAASASQMGATLHRVGPHEVVELPGPRLDIELVGRVTGAHADELARLAGTLSAGQRLTVLADLRRMGKVGPDARAAFQAGLQDQPVGAVAIVGLNAAIRTLAKVAIGAVNLVKREKVQVAFFKRPAEAARWLERLG